MLNHQLSLRLLLGLCQVPDLGQQQRGRGGGGGVSGGHLNPAVTVALASVGRFPWRRVVHYLAAQYLGALVGGACVFFLYWDALVEG